MIKPIELTEKHKEMLLKMCRELYPEYSVIQFEDIYNYETGNLYFDNMKSGTTIHWFEFCMTHLATKICDGKTYYIFCDRCNSHKKDLTQFSKEFISKYLQHPVDYLYEEFKKLNK